MSHTIAHRPHAHHHLPLAPVLAVIVTALLAAAVIWAINQPRTTAVTPASEAIGAPAVQATLIAPDSPVFRHAQMRAGVAGGYPRAFAVNRHHLVDGSSLDSVSTPPVYQQASGSYQPPDYPRVGR